MLPYRSDEADAPVVEVDFNDLPGALQTRLALASDGAEPACVWAVHLEGKFDSAQTFWPSLSLALSSGLGLLACSREFFRGGSAGFGQLALAAAALLCASVVASGRSLLARREHGGRVFRSGVYLLGRSVIDARQPKLRVIPSSCLTSIELTPSSVAFCLRGREAIVLPWLRHGAPQKFAAEGKELLRQVRYIERAAERAESNGDLFELRRLDPWARLFSPSVRAPTRSRKREWGIIAAAATLLPLSIALAGHMSALHDIIEEAAARGRVEVLASVASRGWLWASYVDDLWASASLRSSRVDAADLYAASGQRPLPFLEQLEARLGDCRGDLRRGCVQALRGLCSARPPRLGAIEQGLLALDPRDDAYLEPPCAPVFAAHPELTADLHERRIRRARGRQDTAALRALGALLVPGQ